jgi:N-acylneuraminate cytidylyltransferase
VKLLAVVAARSGSKRLPGKNARPLGGRPLVAWTIDCALRAACFSDVLVSTDIDELARIARSAGAYVPWLRPAHLATDQATLAEVCFHAADWYERERGRLEGVALLQPTSPFRQIETIRRGVDLFANDPTESVVSVSPAISHPYWCRRIDAGGRLRGLDGVPQSHGQSQDLPRVWHFNGLLYIAPMSLLHKGTLVSASAQALTVLDEIESLDIDTELDWLVAEAVLHGQLAASRGSK